MKIGLVQFPGSNCERETKLALLRVNLESVDCFWYSAPELVASLDGFVIVGGFSYEDRIRSGLIASKDPFMQLLRQAAALGKPILGICNGAQILVESGLLGGSIALAENKRVHDGKLLGTGYYNEWVTIKSNQPPMDHPIRVPIAHAEGRFLLDEAFYAELQASGTMLYTYCGDNPNGSAHDLAAVSNAAGNIMAMMPHPERTPDGDVIFKTFFAQGKRVISQKQSDAVHPLQLKPYTLNERALHYWVGLIIHDNEAISLENTLQEMGLQVSLKKIVHWVVQAPPELRSKIEESDELFNRKKEYLLDPKQLKANRLYIVRQKEDEIAMSKQESLQHILGVPKIPLRREMLWAVSYPEDAEEAVKSVLEGQAIFGNPLSHEGFIYDPR